MYLSNERPRLILQTGLPLQVQEIGILEISQIHFTLTGGFDTACCARILSIMTMSNLACPGLTVFETAAETADACYGMPWSDVMDLLQVIPSCMLRCC